MTTMLRFGAPFLVALGALAGCIPTRDNANDIANRPVAVLSVENGPFGAACEEADSVESPFSRGRCLHLSGRESTDPQDDIVEYVFEVRTDGNAAWTLLTIGTLASGDTLVLAPADLRTLKPGLDYQVRMTAVDENGGSDLSGIATFNVSNTQPTVLQPGNRYVPAFGALWRRSPNPMGGEPVVGGGLTVRVQSRGAIDEEDDPLSYCWVANAFDAHLKNDPCPAPASECVSTETFIEQEIASNGQPDSNGRAEYLVQVCDGNLWSRPVRASIVIREPPAWAIERDFERAVIVDADQRTEQIPYPVVGVPGFQVDTQDRIRAFFGWDDPATFGKDRNLVRMQLVSSSAGGPVSTVTLDSDAVVRKVIPAAAAGVAWVVANVGTDGLGVYMITGTSGVPSVDGPWMPDPPVDVNDADSIFTAVDPDTGDLWMSAAFEKYAWGLEANGTIGEIVRISLDDHIVDEHMVTGVGIRDAQGGMNSVWIGHARHSLVPGSAGEAGVLVYANQGVESRTLEIAEDLLPLVEGYDLSYAFGPYFNSPESFYVTFFGSGVGFFGIANSAAKLIDFTPTPVVGFASALHPASGELIIVSQGQQTLLRVAPEGGAAVLETTAPIADLTSIARKTRVLSYLPESDTMPARAILGQGTGVEGLTQRFAIPPLFGNSMPGHDYSSGDLWVPSVIPIGAARFYADGRLADFLFGAADAANTAVSPFGAARHVASDPADGALWLVTVRDTSGNANVVWRVDPYGARVLGPGVAAHGGVDGVELGVEEDVLAIAAQPAVESTSAALVMLVRENNGDGTADYTVQRMLPDGTFDPPSPTLILTADLQLPQPVFLARDLVEPGVCVAARHPVANQIFIRRYSPTLSTFTQVSQPTAGPPKLLALAAFDQDCWITFRQGGAIALGFVRPETPGFTPVGIPLPGISEPASIVPVLSADGIRPETSHRVLVDFPDDDVIRRYAIRVTSGGVQLLEEDEGYRTDGDVRLLTP